MRKFFIFFTIIVFKSSFALMQKNDSLQKNSAFIEIGGSGFYYSFDYERNLFRKNLFEINSSLGIAYYPFQGMHNATYIPISVYATYHKRKNKFQFGGGYTPIFRWDRIVEEKTIFNYDNSQCVFVRQSPKDCVKGHDEPFMFYYFFLLSFRRELGKDFFMEFKFTPLSDINVFDRIAFMPWGGISFGKYF